MISLLFSGRIQGWDLRLVAGVRTTKYMPCTLQIGWPSSALTAPALTTPRWVAGLVPQAVR